MSLLDFYKVSYAQNREDIIIDAFFRDVKKGFYVDVGANDPIDDSVTYLFYKKGWTGINIEPNSNLYEKLCIHRTKDTNLQVGISEKKGKLVLRQYKNHGLSTFADKVKDNYLHEKSEKTDDYEDVEVPVNRLDSIIEENARNNHIHFMKIDVEGYEYEVIKSSNWAKIRPELLCIESNHIVKDWRPMLEEANYNLVFNDGLNDYYLAHESMQRAENFDYAEHILLDGQPISPGVERLIRLGEQGQGQLEEIKAQLENQRKQNEIVLKQRNDLFVQLEKYQGVKKQLKMLILMTYSRLRLKAEKVAYPAQYTYPTQSIIIASSRNDLLSSIKWYDLSALSEKRLVGARWRRFLSSFLLFILIIPKILAKFIVRAIRKMKRVLK